MRQLLQALALFGTLAFMLAGEAGHAVFENVCSVSGGAHQGGDTVDMVYFGKTRPVLLRLRIELGKQSRAMVRDAYLKELFALLDRNSDGALLAEEAARAPEGAALASLFGQSGSALYVAPSTQAKMENLDANGDGRVTVEEFMDYYRRNGLTTVRVHYDDSPGRQANALSEILFRALDANGDGQITWQEAAKAEQNLARFDVDDDELITVKELLGRGLAEVSRDAPLAGPQQEVSLFHVVTQEQARHGREHLVQRFLAHYDRDKNRHLDTTEFDLGATAFRQLDKNGDGRLDAGELPGFLDLVPDFEINVHFDGLTVKHQSNAALVRPTDNQGARLELEEARLEIAKEVSDAPAAKARAFLLQQFVAADTQAKGFLEAADMDKPQFRFFKAILRIADRNNDGKLSAAELTAWFDLQEKGRTHFATLYIRDDGRDLFGLLDTSRQGRLSPRDQKNSWGRLAGLADENGGVTRRSIPRMMHLNVTMGWRHESFGAAFLKPAESQSARRGPEWFQKMDRNGDGDISMREWLGSPARFAELDRDGNGLIDPDEAEQKQAGSNPPRIRRSRAE